MENSLGIIDLGTVNLSKDAVNKVGGGSSGSVETVIQYMEYISPKISDITYIHTTELRDGNTLLTTEANRGKTFSVKFKVSDGVPALGFLTAQLFDGSGKAITGVPAKDISSVSSGSYVTISGIPLSYGVTNRFNLVVTGKGPNASTPNPKKASHSFSIGYGYNVYYGKISNKYTEGGVQKTCTTYNDNIGSQINSQWVTTNCSKSMISGKSFTASLSFSSDNSGFAVICAPRPVTGKKDCMTIEFNNTMSISDGNLRNIAVNIDGIDYDVYVCKWYQVENGKFGFSA